MNPAAVRSGILLLAALAAGSGDAAAQLGETRVGTGVRFESYAFADAASVNLDRITLLTLPVSVRVPLGTHLELGVSSGYARGTLRRASGEESELAGLIDTEVRLSARTGDDRFRVGLVALLPTGTSELETAELDVAGVIAADVLPFAISGWGTGGGIGVSAAAALPLSDATSFGVSAGWVLGREYEPLAAQPFQYRPGNQLHVRAALDQMLSRASKATLQLSYQHFGADQGDGTNFYRTGDRLQALGTLAFAAGARASAIVFAGYLRRLEGEYDNPTLPVTAAQDLLYAGASLRQPLGGTTLVPQVQMRMLGTEDGIDQGYTLTAGTGIELRAGRVEVVPSAHLRLGRLTVRTDQESSFTGLDLGISIRNRTLSR